MSEQVLVSREALEMLLRKHTVFGDYPQNYDTFCASCGRPKPFTDYPGTHEHTCPVPSLVASLAAPAPASAAGEITWHGHPGHLCVSTDCLFHLHTTVGRYKISTIGDYYPHSGRTNNGLGQRAAIGSERYFESYVFDMKSDSFSEIDSDAAQDAETAERNHMAMVAKYAALKSEKGEG